MRILFRKLLRNFLASLPVLLLYTHLAFAQKTPPEITPAEFREANILAKKFYKRFIASKDIKPLIREFYVKDFRQRLQEPPAENWSYVLNGDYPPPVPPSERLRQLQKLYESENNFMFLCMLYVNSLRDDTANADIDLFEKLPPETQRVYEKYRPLITQIYEDDEAPGASHYDKESIEFFDKVMDFYDQIIPPLRKATVKINAGHTKFYRPNTKQVSEWMKVFQPWAAESNNHYMGLSDGSRIIYVNIPYFHLALIKENKRLRVVNFVFYVD